MLDPAGRVVLVSGASRGIGRAVAKRLLAAGYAVSAGLRDLSALAAAPRLQTHRYEAEEAGAAEAWVAAAHARFGRIDAVVNAAGINPVWRALDADEAALDAMLRINVKAPMRVARAAWPHLVAAGDGRIVNIASLSGKRVRNANAGYAMSKFALVAATHALRREGWAHGIRVSALCPGFVATDMTAAADFPRDAMTDPRDVAVLVETLLRLPGNAAIAELLVNCRLEDML
jgi:NAD(P)-dependent dehydrogenase (short-subunit alcohol dehydrogenase family)